MKKTLKIVSSIFILYCLVSVGVFFAIKYGVTNTYGKVDENNAVFEDSNNHVMAEYKVELNDNESTEPIVTEMTKRNFCKIEKIFPFFPANAKRIVEEYKKNQYDPLISKMILAVSLRAKSNQDFQNKLIACSRDSVENISIKNIEEKILATKETASAFAWIDLPEWKIIREAVLKDKDKLIKASGEANIAPRLLVGSMIVEQLRLFNSQRELFKKFFEPLKILGNSTKISWGVIGMKEATAIKVEENLKNVNSPYYLGKSYENKLNFTTDDPTQERFLRIADEKNHYYSYLYGAFYLAQMMKQWRNAGFEIMYRPEIVGTLFNVGFPQSRPNPNPKVGGSEINVGEGKYSFGSLAYEFYYSGELAD